MDAERFNQLSRTVATMTRRRSLRLLSAGVLGTLLVRLEVHPVAATHGCRHLDARCRRSRQCCAGARCKKRRCQCATTHFPCGSECCLNGATCLTLPVPGEPKLCQLGDLPPAEQCDPTQPGECTSGICTPIVTGGSPGFCRIADCEAPQGPCEGGASECCEGNCFSTGAFCGGGPRCCGLVGAPCQEDCDCCDFADVICRKGTCCRPEFAGCTASSECCGSLVCDTSLCVKP